MILLISISNSRIFLGPKISLRKRIIRKKINIKLKEVEFYYYLLKLKLYIWLCFRNFNTKNIFYTFYLLPDPWCSIHSYTVKIERINYRTANQVESKCTRPKEFGSINTFFKPYATQLLNLAPYHKPIYHVNTLSIYNVRSFDKLVHIYILI